MRNTVTLRIFTLGFALLFAMCQAHAQTPVAPTNTDESRVPTFELPDPLITTDGRVVDTQEMWFNVRRPELLELIRNEMFGRLSLEGLSFARGDFETVPVFDGLGLRIQYRLVVFRRGSGLEPRVIDVLTYTPNTDEIVPAFLALNFRGNHTIHHDPGIWEGNVYPLRGPQERGNHTESWQVEKLLSRGYALVTAQFQDVEQDNRELAHINSVRRFIEQSGDPSDGKSIATWAAMLSVMLDFIEEDYNRGVLNIDPTKVAVFGHSRLGKTALWAGANDERFGMVISNNSGAGGAALARRQFGETVHRVNTSFPHWFADNFKKYNLDVNSMPFDMHSLISLIAPRPVYVASATLDTWADPRGEFLSAFHADPVYRLLGTDGIRGVTEMPPPDFSIGGTIGYHVRTGRHDVLEFDWEQYIDFADRHFR